MLGATPEDARSAAALERLRAWNRHMDADQVAPLIFTAWLREMTRALLAERLGSVFEDYWDLRPLVLREILTRHQEWCYDPTRPGVEGCALRLAESLRQIGRAHV